MYCTQCGVKVPEGAKFCPQCGASLALDVTTGVLKPTSSPLDDYTDERVDDEGVRSDLLPGTALLVSMRGPNAGARFLLDKDLVTVGRHPDSDIFLDDITVSRRHAEFRRATGTFVVADVGSLNGTYVNGKISEQTPLSNGDTVQVGKFRLKALIPDPAVAGVEAAG